MQAVQLTRMNISALKAKFPHLLRIKFLEIEGLRDKHLKALASSELQIEELQIGELIWAQDANKGSDSCKISDKVHLYFAGDCTSSAY